MFKVIFFAIPFLVLSFLFFVAYSMGAGWLPGVLSLVCICIAVYVMVRGFSAQKKGEKAKRERELNAAQEKNQ